MLGVFVPNGHLVVLKSYLFIDVENIAVILKYH
jgi:hypothetical protein